MDDIHNCKFAVTVQEGKPTVSGMEVLEVRLEAKAEGATLIDLANTIEIVLFGVLELQTRAKQLMCRVITGSGEHNFTVKPHTITDLYLYELAQQLVL